MPKTGGINHLSLTVSDFERGQKFYDFLLKDLLGYDVKVVHPYFAMWNSTSSICISGGNNTPHHKLNPGLHHLAFNAETPELVDEIYTKLVAFQQDEKNKDIVGLSAILDKPQEYPQYRPGYYAVFFTDPDGMKLEITYFPPLQGGGGHYPDTV
ncbi:Glyoxalase/Bleomycin resistance protein/Dihydroxybiphenyl dioxygenase [Mortierella sp. GBAus27b]|nr:hypothetical protein BGX31_005154 [Mortierella sp. GBA43]KAI8361250.1 Glyoxalase/Bleomycin resistance protein/Dihydroxybiphenyl dioxygenase [Mortierella sp. GBAus27b]